MPFYEDIQELADLLEVGEDFGMSTDTRPISILRRIDLDGASDLDAPTTTYPPERVNAATFGVNERRDGNELKALSDVYVLIDARTTEAPTLEDRIQIGTESFTILRVQAIPEHEIKTAYKVYLAK